jgi:hypothetical protein
MRTVDGYQPSSTKWVRRPLSVLFALAVATTSAGAGGLFLPTSASAATHAALTPSGAKMKVGQTANVTYNTTETGKATSTLAITLTSVRQGSISDLSNFELDAQSKEGVPFYVAAKFRNVGTRPVAISGIFGDMNVYDKQGDTIDSITLLGNFPKCQGTEPDSLAVGHQFQECDVYIAPVGEPVATVVFDNFLNDPSNTETEVTWVAG